MTPRTADADVPIPFEVLFHHREGLRTDHLRLRLLAPPRDGSAFVAVITVESPPNHRSSRTVGRDIDGWTVVDIGPSATADAADFGVGNVTCELIVTPTARHPVDTLFVAVDATLSAASALGRRRYRLDRTCAFPFV